MRFKVGKVALGAVLPFVGGLLIAQLAVSAEVPGWVTIMGESDEVGQICVDPGKDYAYAAANFLIGSDEKLSDTPERAAAQFLAGGTVDKVTDLGSSRLLDVVGDDGLIRQRVEVTEYEQGWAVTRYWESSC